MVLWVWYFEIKCPQGSNPNLMTRQLRLKAVASNTAINWSLELESRACLSPILPFPHTNPQSESTELTSSQGSRRRNENSAHVKNDCSVAVASRMCPAQDSPLPAQGTSQGSGPPCPVESRRLKKPPYAHGRGAQAVWEEGREQLDPVPRARGVTTCLS